MFCCIHISNCVLYGSSFEPFFVPFNPFSCADWVICFQTVILEL